MKYSWKSLISKVLFSDFANEKLVIFQNLFVFKTNKFPVANKEVTNLKQLKTYVCISSNQFMQMKTVNLFLICVFVSNVHLKLLKDFDFWLKYSKASFSTLKTALTMDYIVLPCFSSNENYWQRKITSPITLPFWRNCIERNLKFFN